MRTHAGWADTTADVSMRSPVRASKTATMGSTSTRPVSGFGGDFEPTSATSPLATCTSNTAATGVIVVRTTVPVFGSNTAMRPLRSTTTTASGPTHTTSSAAARRTPPGVSNMIGCLSRLVSRLANEPSGLNSASNAPVRQSVRPSITLIRSMSPPRGVGQSRYTESSSTRITPGSKSVNVRVQSLARRPGPSAFMARSPSPRTASTGPNRAISRAAVERSRTCPTPPSRASMSVGTSVHPGIA